MAWEVDASVFQAGLRQTAGSSREVRATLCPYMRYRWLLLLWGSFSKDTGLVAWEGLSVGSCTPSRAGKGHLPLAKPPSTVLSLSRQEASLCLSDNG